MSIEALYADGIEASIKRQVANPTPEPSASFSLGSFLAAGMRGFPAAGLEVGGSVLDLARTVPEDLAEKRRRDAMGVPTLTGNELRAKAQDFAPDPMTSHAADQVLFGLTRVGAKVAAALSAANPPVAGALLMAEGTNTGAQNLMAKGVDKDTAILAGAVEGAGQAAAILPVVGPGVKSTIALGAAGGPGAFMAQEAMSKRILGKAGYHDEASRHDPLDPLGLTIATLLPGVIGGVHIARLQRPVPMGSVKVEADMKTAATLTPQELEISANFEKSAGNLAELRDAIAKEKRPEARALLEQELKTQTEKIGPAVERHVANRASVDPAIVDAARVRVTQDALHKSLPDVPEAHAQVMRAADEIGAGRMPDVEPVPTTSLPEFKAWFGESRVVDDAGEPKVVYHGTRTKGDVFDEFDLAKTGSKTDEGYMGRGFYFGDEKTANAYAGHYEFDPAHFPAGGAVVPAYLSLKNPAVLLDRVENGRRVDLSVLSREAAGLPKTATSEEVRRALEGMGHDGVIYKVSDTGYHEYVAFNPEQIKSATGNSGKFDPNSASLTDPLLPGERDPRANALPEPVPEKVQPIKARPDDVQAIINARKRLSVLKSLLECLE